MPVDVFAKRSMVDWDEIDRISAILGESDCMICAAVATVILRFREKSGVSFDKAVSKTEIDQACNFVGWKIRSIVRTASHD